MSDTNNTIRSIESYYERLDLPIYAQCTQQEWFASVESNSGKVNTRRGHLFIREEGGQTEGN